MLFDHDRRWHLSTSFLPRLLVITAVFRTCLSAQAFEYLPVSKNQDIIRHKFYTLSFLDKEKEAEWVAYKLTDYMTQGTARRSNKFKTDPAVKSGSATPRDYKNTGYDKGHLCPAADMKWDTEAMNETFYMSNMTPQLPGFNRGIWKKLEDQVREWAVELGEIYVVTGVVAEEGLETIGIHHDVAVPKYFYKIVMEYTEHEKKAIAFLLPNESSTTMLPAYVVPIDSIETLTRINFFPSLSDSLKHRLEDTVHLSDWDFTYPKRAYGQ